MNEPEDSGVGKYLFAAAILGLTLLVGAKAPKDLLSTTPCSCSRVSSATTWSGA